MKIREKLIHFLFFLFIPVLVTAQEWSLKQAPLMTQWATRVDPKNPLPEYPRPQLVRNEWLNLNGIWQFQSGTPTDIVPTGKTLSGRILVPYPVESPLSGVMEHYDRLWYRRTFTVPPAWKGKRIILNFGAVDWESEIYINGKSVGIHKGGYDAFAYDVTSFLQGKGNQELIVRVFDPTEAYGQPRGKQTTNQEQRYGIMYTPTTGIWQTVWLEPVEPNHISDIKLIPDVDKNRLRISVNVTGSASGLTVTATAKDGSTIIGSVKGNVNTEFSIPIPKEKLWSYDTPFLYDLIVELKKDTKTVDNIKSYFGMRKISIAVDGGFKKIFLNNKFVFQIGPLDQGFWPDGVYTAPTDEALKYDIEQTKAHGFNLIRKHIKVEPQRWYYWADKLGILVWQDMPAVNAYMGSLPKPAIDTLQFKLEMTRMIESHFNNPSIIMWILFNEDQGRHNSEQLVQTIRGLDSSRLISAASGGKHFEEGDIYDLHRYPEPGCPSSSTQAVVCGEFGGIAFRISGHEWNPPKSHGYMDVYDPDELINSYNTLITQLVDFKNNKGLSAAIYTETTDIETEINGFMTYDRLLKTDAMKFKACNQKVTDNTSFSLVDVLPTSQNTFREWKYTTDKPAAEWKDPGFDDSSWASGKALFGTSAPVGEIRTKWSSSDIWMRQHFNPGSLTDDELNNLVFNIHHKDRCEIYINGILAGSRTNSTGDYSILILNIKGRNAIRPDADNIIAVHCVKRTGDQYIDVGISRTVFSMLQTGIHP